MKTDVEIKPGAELDRAVAEAIGFRGAIRSLDALACPPTEHFVLYVDEQESRPWLSSIDLNAAFAAAEKVGLWNRTSADDMMSLTKDDGAWHMQCCNWHETGPTPALAICAAILKLKNEFCADTRKVTE